MKRSTISLAKLAAMAVAVSVLCTAFACPTQGGVAREWGNSYVPFRLLPGNSYISVAPLGLAITDIGSMSGSLFPPGHDYVAVTWAYFHGLALKGDGSVIAAGIDEGFGVLDVPPDHDFVDIAAGGRFNVALKENGSLVGWGMIDDLPADADFVDVAAGTGTVLALREDGSLWSRHPDTPPGNDFVAIAGGMQHYLALRADGSLAAWGDNAHGQCDVPAGHDFVAVAAGGEHSLAVCADGSLVAWGANGAGQCDVPAGNGFSSVAAVEDHSYALEDPPSLDSVADGDFHAPSTWNDGSLIPGLDRGALIDDHRVDVTEDSDAMFLTAAHPDGRASVAPGHTLTVVESVDVAAGKLDVQGTVDATHLRVAGGSLQVGPTGTVNVSGSLWMDFGSEYICQLAGASNGVINAESARVDYYDNATRLTLQATGKLEGIGETRRMVLSVPSWTLGRFREEPAEGEHLGHGVFHKSVYYQPYWKIFVTVFQAADGDTDGDREIGGCDIEAILAANKFGKDEQQLRAEGLWPADWPEGDFTGDGTVGGDDVQAILATNLFGTGPYAGLKADAAEPGDLRLLLAPDGLLIDTGGQTINGYVLTSQAGIFTGEPADNLGLFQEDTDRQISANFAFTLNGQHLIGDVIGDEFADVDLLEDLTFSYTIQGRTGIYYASLTVPEPSALAMLAGGLVALCLLGRRRFKSPR